MDTMALKNERTGETDFVRGVPENHRDYIPQDENCLTLFDLYVLSGKSECDACIEVLRLVTGVGTAQQTDVSGQPKLHGSAGKGIGLTTGHDFNL